MALKIIAGAVIAAFLIAMIAGLIGSAQSSESISKALGPF